MRPISRRSLVKGLAALSLTAVSGGLTSCAGAPAAPAGEAATSAPEAAAPAQAVEEFSLEVLESWMDDYLVYMSEVIEPQVKDKWPGIRFNYIPIDWGTLEEKLLTGAASGSLPDVYRQGAQWVPTTSKTALPLDDRVAEWGQKDDFPKGVWDTVVWEGKSWGIPQLTTPQYWCYRKDITDAEGVTIDPEWDFDQYLEYTRALTKIEDGKVVRMGSSAGTNWQGSGYGTILLCADGRYTKDGKAAFAGEEGIWALTHLVERNNIVGPQGMAPLPSSEIPYLALGMHVIEYGHPGYNEVLVKQSAPEVAQYIEVPDPPIKKKRVATIFTDWLAIGKTTKHVDAAWEFVRLHAEPEALIQFNKGWGFLPTRTSAMEQAAYISESKVLQADVRNLHKYGLALPLWPNATKLEEILNLAIEEACLLMKTPEEALVGAAKEWDVVLQAAGWQD